MINSYQSRVRNLSCIVHSNPVTGEKLSGMDRSYNIATTVFKPLKVVDKIADGANAAKKAEKIKDAKKQSVGRKEEVKDSGDLSDSLKYKEYIRDIEAFTDYSIGKEQRSLLKETLQKNKFTKLNQKDSAKHRREFTKLKNQLISDWEKNTGQKWLTYTETIYTKSGKPYKRPGDKYDAHEIIKNSYGGPLEWWNIHPARWPDQHQGGIHRSGSPEREIFND